MDNIQIAREIEQVAKTLTADEYSDVTKNINRCIKVLRDAARMMQKRGGIIYRVDAKKLAKEANNLLSGCEDLAMDIEKVIIESE